MTVWLARSVRRRGGIFRAPSFPLCGRTGYARETLDEAPGAVGLALGVPMVGLMWLNALRLRRFVIASLN